MKRLLLATALLLCAACHRSEPPASPAPADEPAAAPTPTAGPREALPRAVGGVTLGMSTADAGAQLGKLTCHENAQGFRVCTGTKDQGADITHLEVYLNHDHVISLAYETTPTNAWDFLDRLIARYGSPSLSGRHERDKTGRLHEIYGWKDDDSLYSVRLIWRETETGGRDLVGTAIALWDRKGYQEWEAEAKQRMTTTPTPAPLNDGEKT